MKEGKEEDRRMEGGRKGEEYFNSLEMKKIALVKILLSHVNNALLGGGVRATVWIREQQQQQKKIKRRSKALLSL